MDLSSSKDFVKEMVNIMRVGADDTHVAFVQYAHKPRLEFGFLDDKELIESTIDSIKYIRSGTKTGLALNFVTEEVLPLSIRKVPTV